MGADRATARRRKRRKHTYRGDHVNDGTRTCAKRPRFGCAFVLPLRVRHGSRVDRKVHANYANNARCHGEAAIAVIPATRLPTCRCAQAFDCKEETFEARLVLQWLPLRGIPRSFTSSHPFAWAAGGRAARAAGERRSARVSVTASVLPFGSSERPRPERLLHFRFPFLFDFPSFPSPHTASQRSGVSALLSCLVPFVVTRSSLSVALPRRGSATSLL